MSSCSRTKWRKSQIASRVFRYLILTTFLISILITGLYSASSYHDYSVLQINNGERVSETIANQIAAVEKTTLNLVTVLFSSDTIYRYLSATTDPIPSIDWFSSWNEMNNMLAFCGRSQINNVLGIMLFRSPEESTQYGSFYSVINPYRLTDDKINRLFTLDQHLFFVSSIRIGTNRNAFIVVQLYDTVFDTLCRDLLIPGSRLELRDDTNEIVRSYSTGSASDGTAHITQRYHLVERTVEGCGWTVQLHLPADYLISFLAQALPWMICTLLISFFLSLYLSIHLSISLSWGFQNLQSNILHVEKEEYDLVESIDGEDELAKTSQSLRHMAVELARLTKEHQERTDFEHQLELQVLRSQVSPHFLYNALCSVSQLCSMQGMEHVAKMCTSLIQLLRATLANEGALVPLSQEIECVQNYYEICQYQLAGQVEIREKIDDECRSAYVVHMILQPIVENAMIHGMTGINRNGIILIRAEHDQNTMHISVVDNGQGMDDHVLRHLLEQERNDNHRRFSGIGIRNVHERIRLRFGEPYGLTISSKVGHYTRVDILLPFLPNEGGYE